MNVAQVSTWQVPCGIAGYAERLCVGLSEHGVDCDVIAIDRGRTDYLPRGELREYFEDLVVRAMRNDVVHIQHEFGFFAGAYGYHESIRNFRRFLARLRRAAIPTIVTFHTDPYWFERRTGVLFDESRQLGAKALWRAGVINAFGASGRARALVHSYDTRRRLVDAGIPADAIDVVRQGVPTLPGETTAQRRATARAWLGLPSDAIVLAVFGFVAEYKGHATAVEALRSLPEEYHLLVAGGQPPRDGSKAMNALLAQVDDDPEIAARVRITGYIDEAQLRECLVATDMCLLPYGDFPRLASSAALTWAMASGRPVIASSIPAFREFAQQVECLQLIAPEAPSELALAVQALTADHERRRELVAAAVAFSAEHTWQRSAAEHLDLYERVLATHRPAGVRRGLRPLVSSVRPVPAAAAASNGRARGPQRAPVSTRRGLSVNGTAAPRTASALDGEPPTPVRILHRAQYSHVEIDDDLTFWLAHDALDDPVVAAMSNGGLADDPCWQLVRHLTGPGATLVDLGAHVGTFALPMAAAGARVLAVEASPNNARLLRAAALRNNFEHLEVVNAVITDRSGRTMFTPNGPYGHASLPDDVRSGARATCPVEIRAATLDQLLGDRGWSRVDVVKLDLEGSELRALAGMQRLLTGPEPPVLVLECNAFELERQGSSASELLGAVERLGYQLLLIDSGEPGRLVPVRATDTQPRCIEDYLAIHGAVQIAPPWRVAGYSPLDVAGRVISEATSEHVEYRRYAARALQTAPADVVRQRSVQHALQRLADDPIVAVRHEARSSANGTPRPQRARKPFWHQGHATFAFAASIDGSGGYGYSAEELACAAAAQGAEISWLPLVTVDDRCTAPAVRALQAPLESRHEHELLVVYSAPYSWTGLRAPITIGMTMFETTELPDSWVAACESTQGLIVPSEFNREVFSRKLSVPIEVVPLGVNPSVYPELERPEHGHFSFLMAGGLSVRKAPDIAIRAFELAFRRNEPVRLVLKAYRDTLDLNGVEIRDGRITVLDGQVDRRGMLELYRNADCLIACSRGEASGLTPREAMSTGIPAIVTNWGGLREIANPDCAFALDVDGEEPGFGRSFPPGVTGGSSIGMFATPSVDHLAELMRRAYEDRDATRAMGRRAAAWMRAAWTYDQCAHKWVQAIGRLVAAGSESGATPLGVQ
jgi:FkbM family methyltransferase